MLVVLLWLETSDRLLLLVQLLQLRIGGKLKTHSWHSAELAASQRCKRLMSTVRTFAGIERSERILDGFIDDAHLFETIRYTDGRLRLCLLASDLWMLSGIERWRQAADVRRWSQRCGGGPLCGSLVSGRCAQRELMLMLEVD